MFNNYLKSALRFLKQNKLFAGINALGLSIALAASFLILLFVINELSFDQCHKNRKRVYKVINYYKVFNKTFSGTPYILAHALKDEFPQIRKAVNLRHVRGFKLKLKDEFVNIMDVEATDSDIFDIFTLPLIMGSSHQNLLDDQSSIVLSRDMADKFFRGQNPIGKEILGLVNKEEHIFIVKGVYENIPVNSTFRAECMVNSKWTLAPLNKDFNISDIESRWDMDFWITWVLLSDDCNVKSLENQFIGFEIKNISEKPDSQYSLQNLSDVYLGSDNILNTQIQGNISNLRLFSGIAFLIILVSAINYIILSTAVSSSRSKEIGIRKTYGAGINSIKNQLLSESVLLALLVLPISLVMMWLTMPYAGKLFQTQLHIINSNILVYVSVYLTLTIFIGVVSGIYMSSYLSSLKVLDILKSTVHSGKRRLFFRQSLIVIQLVIFCSFVACTLIIRSQYRYALKIDMGYYNSEILLIDLGNGFSGYSVYINNIKSNPNVIMAAGTMEGLPMQNSGFTMIPNFQYKDQKVEVEAMAIDYNFLKTMGISVIQGRDFSKEYGSDPTQSIILNETAVKQLGIIDPLGKMINDQTIIGIVKDFNLHSIHSKIPPLTIHLTEKYIQQVVVHYKPGTLTSILPMLETEWKKAAPDRRFSYETIEDLIQSLYSSEKNLTSIVSIFALFTLLIAALGLFGLTLFVAKSRTKEIGIKKVFGSLEKSIIYSFLFENFILVSLAAIISVPLTLHFMRRWLNNFAFKVNISWWVFIISFAVALVVVLLTVFFHSYKASHLNPVNALKYE
jgi:putative ABC transport system permease protein